MNSRFSFTHIPFRLLNDFLYIIKRQLHPSHHHTFNVTYEMEGKKSRTTFNGYIIAE